jgi:Leucine-rich repeat (LRR) protein
MPNTSINIIPQNGNSSVVAIDCGMSSPRLGGTINLSQFVNLTTFRCQSNDITSITGHTINNQLISFDCRDNKITGSIPISSANSALAYLNCEKNQLTGSIPSLSSFSNLTNFYCAENQLTGAIPSLSLLSNLRVFYCSQNQLTGSIPAFPTSIVNCTFNDNQLTGSIPAFPTSIGLFYCFNNGLTGSIPSLNGLTQLTDFRCQAQNGVTKLTGSIPSLSDNSNLIIFACDSNQLTGSIPDLINNIKLEFFYCNSNQLNGFAGGSVSNTLGIFEAHTNQLTASTVNAILAAFVAAGRTSASGTCVLNLGGTGNAAPTGQGLTDKTTLISRGWNVTTN